MPLRYAVEVLALEVGHRGVTVNTMLPTGIEGAGVFTDTPAHDDPIRTMIPRPIEGRMSRIEDVADAAEHFSGPLAHWVSGQTLLISGGALQQLGGPGGVPGQRPSAGPGPDLGPISGTAKGPLW
ncbi:SDR family oxidoreductase [Kribbella sp. CA-253562]|uniref:SDR family oxidoreductase n=1 Tax=Kribbella sp. CA-253562 TaxID=3239942 RepID=UPI003D943D4B